MKPKSAIRAAVIALAPFLSLLVVSSLAVASVGEPEENVHLVPATEPPGAWTLQWTGRTGRTYFVQHSHDLHSWTYINTIKHGEGAKMLGTSSTGNRYFLRLWHTDIPCLDPATADFDGDGLNNADELNLLCDPFLADSDGDGFSDGWEVMVRWDPKQNNANQAHLDPDGDGWDNATEHLYGTNPNLVDSDEDGLDEADDADPNDSTIDWPRAPEATRVWIPLTDYDPSTHGAPVALSNTGIALFEKALWKGGVWKTLEWEKPGPSLTYTDGPNGSEVISTTLRAIRPIDLGDDGRVVGRAELLFTDPHGGDDGTPGTLENAVQWTEDTNGNLVMEITGINVGSQIDLATYWSLPKAAGLSPDGILFTARGSTGNSGGGAGGMVVSGMEWWRQEPTQWKGTEKIVFAQQEGLEWMPFEILGGVWMHARNTVLGGKMGVMRDGTGPNQNVNRLLEGTARTVLPEGEGYVCGALSDNRVAFVSNVGGTTAPSLHLRPLGNTMDFRPVPKLSGTAAFNARGEAISHDGRFWQNGKWLMPVSEGNTPPTGTMHLHDLNDHGVMLGTAGENGGSGGPVAGEEAVLVVGIELVGPKIDANGVADLGSLIELRNLKVSKMEKSLLVEKLAGQVTKIELDMAKDHDSFHLRIPGGAGLAGGRVVAVAAQIKENAAANYNDDSTWLTLAPKGEVLITESLLLNADHPDDDYTGAVGILADDAKDDQTHILQLRGKFSVEKLQFDETEHAIALERATMPKKRVKLHFVIIDDGTVDVSELQQVIARDMEAARERFAQVGIELMKKSEITRQTPINLTDGRLLIDSSHKHLSEDLKSLIRASGGDGSTDDIHVLYVPNSLVGGIYNTSLGVALNSYWNNPVDAKFLGNIFMTSQEWAPGLAHEIGHLLTDKPHIDIEDFPNNPEYQEKLGINLMYDPLMRNGGISESKRFLQCQENDMMNSPYAKQPE